MFEDLSNNLLTVLVFLPVLSALVVALLPKDQPNLARWVALALSIPPLLLAVGLFIDVVNSAPNADGFYHEYTTEWFPEIGAYWHVGVDGISISMVLLTAILTPLAILIAFEHVKAPKAVLALILFLETAMFGVFITLDTLAFFVFWELGLVPMYFLIDQWGGANRQYAAMKFFIYTMAGSLGLLLSIQMIAWTVGQEVGAGGPVFDLKTWYEIWPTLGRGGEILGFDYNVVKYLAFLSFFVAFSIKIPVWPFHTWLPDAHTEAPTAGSMLLAGVLLKQGAYGFIRFVIPLFPEDFAAPRAFVVDEVTFTFAGLLALLAMLGIVLGAFAAWAQDDLKKLVAYSSVNHMGFVVLGLAAAAMMYGAMWAQSPQGADDPILALQILNEDLEVEDIQTYELPVNRVIGDIEDLEDQERLSLARLKLAALEEEGMIPDNIDNANVALNGAVLQMFNHGLSSAAMFLLVGALYHKAHTRDLRRFGGLWHIIPVYGFLFVFTSMASLGLPGLNGFTSEWLVISGSFPLFPLLVVLSMLGLLMTGAYILKGIQKVLHGPTNPEWLEYHEHHHSLEINLRETLAVAPLVVLMLITGIYPNWILEVINATVTSNFFNGF